MDEKYNFRVPQKALISKNGKFLLLRRSSTAKIYPDLWDLPGGKLEHGENPIEGLVREVLEETSLKIKVLKPIFAYSELNAAYVYVVIFESNIISGEVKLSIEHSEYKWASKKEALELKLEPYLQKYFSQID